MNKFRLFVLIIGLALVSFNVHKFYVAIYQINFVSDKKRIEITSRIFVDDLNAALEKKFHQKSQIGDSGETADDIAKMNQYLLEHIKIKVNGKPKTILFVRKEMESNVVVCYHKIVDVPVVKSIYIDNSTLMELFPDQQNIIQTSINGKKQSLLLTADNSGGVLK
jgi:hypothetical protein